MFDYGKLFIYCDEQQDLDLLKQLSLVSDVIGKVGEENLKILPKAKSSLERELPEAAARVVTEERPDYCFIYKDRPILIIELTEHGYTGDNPLQRFARCAAAAENHIPYIYMTPFSRVRDDEMDRERGGSERYVNTDVFKGMHILSKVFSVPQIALNWITAQNGKPRKVRRNASVQEIRDVFGELADTIDEIIPIFSDNPSSTEKTLQEAYIKQKSDKLELLYAKSNRRIPTTRFITDRVGLREILDSPNAIFRNITKEDYFFKDKPERLLAYFILQESKWDVVRLPSGELIKGVEAKKFLDRLVAEKHFDNNLIYYTGYKWRSDPHSGVAVNTDYIFCRQADGRSTKDRHTSLILVYPRVFLRANSILREKVHDNLKLLSDKTGGLSDLFHERFPVNDVDKKITSLLGSTNIIGIWGDRTKQSRIFRRYCDIIILADAVIIGNNWEKEAEEIIRKIRLE